MLTATGLTRWTRPCVYVRPVAPCLRRSIPIKAAATTFERSLRLRGTYEVEGVEVEQAVPGWMQCLWKGGWLILLVVSSFWSVSCPLTASWMSTHQPIGHTMTTKGTKMKNRAASLSSSVARTTLQKVAVQPIVLRYAAYVGTAMIATSTAVHWRRSATLTESDPITIEEEEEMPADVPEDEKKLKPTDPMVFALSVASVLGDAVKMMAQSIEDAKTTTVIPEIRTDNVASQKDHCDSVGGLEELEKTMEYEVKTTDEGEASDEVDACLSVDAKETQESDPHLDTHGDGGPDPSHLTAAQASNVVVLDFSKKEGKREGPIRRIFRKRTGEGERDVQQEVETVSFLQRLMKGMTHAGLSSKAKYDCVGDMVTFSGPQAKGTALKDLDAPKDNKFDFLWSFLKLEWLPRMDVPYWDPVSLVNILNEHRFATSSDKTGVIKGLGNFSVPYPYDPLDNLDKISGIEGNQKYDPVPSFLDAEWQPSAKNEEAIISLDAPSVKDKDKDISPIDLEIDGRPCLRSHAEKNGTSDPSLKAKLGKKIQAIKQRHTDNKVNGSDSDVDSAAKDQLNTTWSEIADELSQVGHAIAKLDD